MVVSLVPVEPIYGNGWDEGDKRVQQPLPFSAELAFGHEGWTGIVLDGEYTNWKIHLADSFTGRNGYMNLRLVDAASDRVVTGYAMVPVECLTS